jgi:hypothetical protein
MADSTWWHRRSRVDDEEMRRAYLSGFGEDVVPVKAGQTFYYDAVIEGQDWVSDWKAVATATLNSTAGISSGRVVGADRNNISLGVTSTMDRARQNDLESDLTTALAAQPGVTRVIQSMLRRTSADAPNSPGAPGAKNPFADMPVSVWIVLGIGMIFLMKR